MSRFAARPPTRFQAKWNRFAVRKRKKQTAAPRRGLLRRLFDKIMDNRQLSANRDIEAFLARRGHRLTDSIERDLNDHLFNGGWHARR